MTITTAEFLFTCAPQADHTAPIWLAGDVGVELVGRVERDVLPGEYAYRVTVLRDEKVLMVGDWRTEKGGMGICNHFTALRYEVQTEWNCTMVNWKQRLTKEEEERKAADQRSIEQRKRWAKAACELVEELDPWSKGSPDKLNVVNDTGYRTLDIKVRVATRACNCTFLFSSNGETRIELAAISTGYGRTRKVTCTNSAEGILRCLRGLVRKLAKVIVEKDKLEAAAEQARREYCNARDASMSLIKDALKSFDRTYDGVHLRLKTLESVGLDVIVTPYPDGDAPTVSLTLVRLPLPLLQKVLAELLSLPTVVEPVADAVEAMTAARKE